MKLAIEIPTKRIQDLLCSALEGGSNYWYQISGHDMPHDLSYADFRKGGKFTNPAEYWHPDEIFPVTPGCASLIKAPGDYDKFGVWVNLAAFEHAMELLAEKFPKQAALVIDDEDDAETGDIFLQLAVFGEVIYG